MFKSILITTIMLLSVHVYAQKFTISGVVLDGKTTQPLPGATVQIEGTNRFTIADEFGRFHFEKVPQGSYALLAKFLGYASQSANVTLNEAVEISISLQESVYVTDEVVIFATRANDKTPSTYSTVNRQTLQRQNFGQDLPFLLNWTPSIVTTSDAGTGIGYTGLRIRGSDGTRINVTINGIPYNDSESLGSFWVDIPDIASSSQSVQIQRGVGTSTNGAGAFGASINLQTNTKNDQPYAELINAIGSFDTRRHTLSFGTGLLNNRWVIDGRVSKITSDGFIDRASADLSSYYFSAGFYAGNTVLKAITFGGKERTYQSWYGVPESRLNNDEEAMEITAINEGWNEEQLNNLLQSNSRTFNPYRYKNQVDDYQQDHYQLHLSQRVGSTWLANLSLHYTPGKGFYEEYRYDDDLENYGLAPLVIGDSTIESSDLIRRRWLDNDFYGFTYSVNYEKDNLNSTLGGAWNRYDGDHYGEIIWAQISPVETEHRYYFNNGDKRDFNIFLKTSYQLNEHLSTYLDLQYRRITYEAMGTENKLNEFTVGADYNFFNPKAGVVYTLNANQQIYASYSIGNREPVRDDFVDAPKDKTPKHETLRNLEAGYRLAGKNYMLNFNYYLMHYSNQLVLTGKLNDVGASIRTNVNSSYRTGIEIEGLVKLSAKFSLNANATLSQNKIKTFEEAVYDYGVDFTEYNEIKNIYHDTHISFSPRVISGASLNYKLIKNLEATLLTKYVSRQYLDNTSNNDRSLEAYFVNDLRITYTLNPTFMKELAFSFLLNNFLDEAYESNGYTWGYRGGGEEFRENYYFPQAGRNFMAMITLKF